VQERHQTFQDLFDRALDDPDFLSQLADDPLGTARAQGIQVSAQDLKHLLNMPDASDEQLVEALRARVSHTATHSGGGGQCCCC
jgi:hypothetical protein